MKKLELTDAQYEHIVTAIEGAIEELEELEASQEWFVSLTPERLDDVLKLLRQEGG